MANLQLRSSAFNDHDLMPERLSRSGGNISPPLTWSAPPEGTAELVLLVEDPDGGTPPFLHWLVTGIDPRSSEVPEGQVPPGGHEAANDFGTVGWSGPQPPKGDDPHRYFFRLYAVDQPLQLPDRIKAPEVHRVVEAHELASGVLVGTFAR
ncbi:MAG TPA: YbhB/YbcL family Raf kinase inhibitor-like protein [Micromonosporaceae bacterium]|nr:YbhB/YbcL family Raf kinase inhibitor-like protein [Micromonosporaceae bacterium]